MDKAALHIGAVAFIHRFGSSLNEHVHFHVCVVDGVFEATEPGVIFHPASGLDETGVAQVQATLRRRILRAFVGRGLLESCDAKDMLAYQHSGFSVDAGVCIEAHDRAALERLLRYCARPTAQHPVVTASNVPKADNQIWGSSRSWRLSSKPKRPFRLRRHFGIRFVSCQHDKRLERVCSACLTLAHPQSPR